MFGVVFSFISCTFKFQKHPFAAAKTRGEKGFVLVFMSLSMMVLTAVAGMAVDLGNWYWNADKLQKAADAAALAGAPYLPGDTLHAYKAANDTLLQNSLLGANISSDNDNVSPTNGNPYTPVAYIHQDPSHPSQLNVKVGVKVHSIFIGMIGVKDEWITRSGIGEYRQAVQMGSPGNVLGSEPLLAKNTAYPSNGQWSVQADSNPLNASYWLNIGGGQTAKANGDRYASGDCDISFTDGCTQVGTNSEETKIDGNPSHQYVVHIPKSNGSNPVTLQVFDGAFVNVGDECDLPSLGTTGSGINSSLAAVANKYHLDPSLYQAGASSFCTGDYLQGSSGTGPALTFKVQKADANGTPTGASLSNVHGTYPSVSVNSATELANDLNNSSELRNSFRQWSSVYQFNSPGDYVVTLETPNSATGANRFSLRLGLGSSSSNTWNNTTVANKVSISAKGALVVYTNATGDQSKFYFARLTSSAAGRTLTMELFDIGDAGKSNSVNLRLLPPTGATGISQTNGFLSCVQQGPGLQPAINENSYCGVNGATPTEYNGKTVDITFTVPNSYRCDDDGTNKCWMGLEFDVTQTEGNQQISSTSPSSDTTTWQIDDCGTPDRLVKDNSASSQTCKPLAS